MNVKPYLNFEGRCEEALEFYKKAVGAKIEMLMRCKDAPEPNQTKPGLENKILHSSFTIGDSTIMATDGYNQNKPNFNGISLALAASNEGEAKRLFDALADGGQVRMTLTKTFFSPTFGMLADKFGVPWMVVAEGQPTN
jgi:PhnB protein